MGRQPEIARALTLIEDEPLHVVYGVAGIGKTEFVLRVVEELATRPPWREARNLWMSCAGTSTVEGMIDTLLAKLVGGRRRGRQVTAVDELARALDEVPTVLFLDDVHHLDPPIGELLAQVSRRIRTSRLIVASRVELSLGDAPTRAEYRLGPLDRKDTAQLVGELMKRLQVDAPDVDEVLLQTRGSPFAILRYLTAGAGDQDRQLEETLASLRPDATKILELLACARTPLSTLALDPHAGALRDLTRRFLVEQRKTMITAHVLILEAIQRRMSPEAATAAHLALAAALEAADNAVARVEVVHHLVRGREYERAWGACQRHYLQIAVAGLDHQLLDDLARLQAELPVRQLEIVLMRTQILLQRSRVVEAEKLLASVEDGASPVRWLLQAGEVARRRGRLAEAETAIRSAFAFPPDREQHAKLTYALADIASTRGKGEHARLLLETVHPEVPRERARHAWSIALSYLTQAQFPEAVASAHSGSAVIAGHGFHDLELLLATLEIIGRCECDDLGGASRVCDGVRGEASLGVGLAGIVAFHGGRLQAAALSLEFAATAHGEHGDQLFASIIGYYLVRTQLARGEIKAAREASERVLGLTISNDLATLTPQMHAVFADVLLEAELVEESRRHLATALTASRVTDATRWRAELVGARAAVLEHGLLAARERLASIAKAPAYIGSAPPAAQSARTAAIALETAWIELLGGGAEAALASATIAATHYAATQRPAEEARATALRVLATIAISRSLDAEGARLLEHARSLAQECGHGRALALLSLAQLALRREDPAAITFADRQHLEGRALFAAIAQDQPDGLATLLGTLGLLRRKHYRVVGRTHTHVVAESELDALRRRHHLVVEPGPELITVTTAASQSTTRGGALVCEMLSAIIEARRPVAADELFIRGWGGPDYHPLRHRNTLHVGISRLRSMLRKLLARNVIETTRDGWMLSPDLDAIVIRFADKWRPSSSAPPPQ